MQIDQAIISQSSGLSAGLSSLAIEQPNLVLVFGSVDIIRDPVFFTELSSHFPASALAGCSTAGEIACDDVYEKSCVITAIRFDHTPVTVCSVPLPPTHNGADAGKELGATLKAAGNGEALRAVLVFARGTAINGSELIDGIRSEVGSGVVISGGLAGDDGAFESTVTLSPLGVSGDVVVGVGLYGDCVALHNGSAGGWKPFGPTRRVTKAEGNILYTLDNEPALDLYKRYLGDYAKDLPASGLLFPFEMLSERAESVGLIRTILGVNEDESSLTLAGNIQQGGFVRMMHSSTDQLVLGAEIAAEITVKEEELKNTDDSATLALLVSCVGRKLVMGDRVCEEVEVVGEFLTSCLKSAPVLCGFYSYGEINPHGKLQDCQLHNQTMTIAVIQEYAKR